MRSISSVRAVTLAVVLCLAVSNAGLAAEQADTKPDASSAEAAGKEKENKTGGGDKAEGAAASEQSDIAEKTCGFSPPKGNKDDDKALEAVKSAAFTALGPLNTDIAKSGICYINQLVATNRVDQQTVYGFVRQMRVSLEGMESVGDEGSPERESIRENLALLHGILDNMMRLSYEDWLFQNGNLSNQIQKRLPGMVADAAKLRVDPPAKTPSTADPAKEEKKAGAEASTKSKKAGVADKAKAEKLKAGEGDAVNKDTASKEEEKQAAEPPSARPVSPAVTAKRLEYLLGDLDLLHERYVKSRRILAGIGLGYSYLPRMRYAGVTSIDVSDVLPGTPGGADRFRYQTQFADQGFLSLVFTAKLGNAASLDFSLPNLEETQTVQTGVFSRPTGNPGEELLTRASVETKLTSQYDLNLRFSLFSIFNSYAIAKHEKEVIRKEAAAGRKLKKSEIGRPSLINSRDDIEVGIGLTGFGIEESVSTDFRRRTDPTKTYTELTSLLEKDEKHESNFHAVYATINYRLDVTDQLVINVNARQYLDSLQGYERVEIDGLTMGMNITYAPLFF